MNKIDELAESYSKEFLDIQFKRLNEGWGGDKKTMHKLLKNKIKQALQELNNFQYEAT